MLYFINFSVLIRPQRKIILSHMKDRIFLHGKIFVQKLNENPRKILDQCFIICISVAVC